MSERPEPLVHADVDLRDFAFMPLDVVRLRDSGLTAKASGDEFRAAVLLWCASWHQKPAASLPNDDDELANLCGYARAMREWLKIRKGALRGWIECSDGRLYHPMVAAKARDAWQSKMAQRARTEAARKAREEARQRQSQSLSQTNGKSVTEDVTESKGQGQGQGQGQGLEVIPPKAPRKRRAEKDSETLTRADLVAEGVDQTHAADWLAVRKAKHAPLTATAWDAVKREAILAAMTPGQAVQVAAERGWQGFKAAWLKAEPVAKVNGADPFHGAL